MRRKSCLLLSLLMTLTALSSYAAEEDRVAEVKVNLLAGAVTIFNPSLELGVGERSSLTAEYIGSFAEYDFMKTGYPLLISVGMVGYRYYLKSSDKSGFFVGADAGLTQYRMAKNVVPLVANDHNGGQIDVGHGYLLGCTVGYKRYIGERFSLEASLSGGYQHSRHEQYRVDGTRSVEFNATAEWTPYKAAINLGYRLWR